MAAGGAGRPRAGRGGARCGSRLTWLERWPLGSFANIPSSSQVRKDSGERRQAVIADEGGKERRLYLDYTRLCFLANIKREENVRQRTKRDVCGTAHSPVSNRRFGRRAVVSDSYSPNMPVVSP